MIESCVRGSFWFCISFTCLDVQLLTKSVSVTSMQYAVHVELCCCCTCLVCCQTDLIAGNGTASSGCLEDAWRKHTASNVSVSQQLLAYGAESIYLINTANSDAFVTALSKDGVTQWEVQAQSASNASSTGHSVAFDESGLLLAAGILHGTVTFGNVTKEAAQAELCSSLTSTWSTDSDVSPADSDDNTKAPTTGRRTTSAPTTAAPTPGPTYSYVPLLQPGPKTWSEARTACQGLGGDLAKIRDQSDNAAVQAVAGSTAPWIGLSDAISEGVWKWTDGEALQEPQYCQGKNDGVMVICEA
jgi:hypothetical protein